MVKLTIAIPTYNRNEILKRNIEFLLPQVTTDCTLLILDNCSDIPVKETLAETLQKYPDVNVRIVRNAYNLGMTANILRCFEFCIDPWLWILGDDDQVKEGAVKQIFADTQNYKECHFLSYAWDVPSLQRKMDIVTVGVDELMDSFETLGVILFISNSVYSVNKVIKSISYANFFQVTYAPHLVLLFMSLGDKGKCVLSSKQIVINEGFDTPLQLRWDQIFIYQITILLRLPLKPVTIYKLRHRLVQLTRVWTIEHLIYSLAYMKYGEGKDESLSILYDEIVRSFFHLDRRITSRITILIGYIVVRHPNIFKPLMGYIYKLVKGKEFDPNNNFRI